MVNRLLVENLGPVKKCEIQLGQETILLGKNNSGKTYISYLLYGMYKRIDREKSKFLEGYLSNLIVESKSLTIRVDKEEISSYLGEKIVHDLNAHLRNDLPLIFNASVEDFMDTEIEVTLSDIQDFLQDSLTKLEGTYENYSIKNLHTTIKLDVKNDVRYWELTLEEMDLYFDFDDSQQTNGKFVQEAFLKVAVLFFSRKIFATPTILYIPAERNGINVFRRELSIKRSSKSFDINAAVTPSEKYPLPIADYMKYLNDLDLELAEKSSNNDARLAVWGRFSSEILKGKYEYDSQQNEYYYRELYSTSKEKTKYKTKKIPLQISSSSIKSLFGLEYYFKYLFSKGDILFIDEPEMNLDPGNQVKFAEFLYELTRFGVKIIISSHSDYLIRATSNEILKTKINSQNQQRKVIGYYFESNEVREIGDLAEVEYMDIFDDMNVQLEDTYFLLKNKLHELQDKEGLIDGDN